MNAPRGAGTASWPRADARREVEEVREALASGARAPLAIAGFAPAAVLVPVLELPEGAALLFTVRASHLTHHAGQIAFPGGRCEAGEDVVDAALRETSEEIGLEVAHDDVLGLLDDHPSPYGLIATPVVARIAHPAALDLRMEEVSETFLVPLSRLRHSVPTWEDRVTNGLARRLHRFDVDGYAIWGLTGNVVKDLLDRLAPVGTGRRAP